VVALNDFEGDASDSISNEGGSGAVERFGDFCCA
jgi:hypothetical protein